MVDTAGNAILYGATSILRLNGRISQYKSEQHEMRVSHTEYPVEVGAQVIDHSVRLPHRLKIDGVVSTIVRRTDIVDIGAEGLGLVTGRRTERFEADASRPFRAWAAVQELMESRELLTVVTLLGTYERMLIVRAKGEVDRSTGENARLELELRELLAAERAEDISSGIRRVADTDGTRPSLTAQTRAAGQTPTAPIADLGLEFETAFRAAVAEQQRARDELADWSYHLGSGYD